MITDVNNRCTGATEVHMKQVPYSPGRYGDRLTRDAVAWFGGGFVLIAAVAAAAVFAKGYGPGFLLVSLGAFALFGITAVRFVRDYHPFERFGSANVVTTVRTFMACLLAGAVTELCLLGQQDSRAAPVWVAIAFGAICLDGLDGFIARRQHMTSLFGARFDMEVDAFLLLVLSSLAWAWDKAGAWVLAIGGLRYAFLIAGVIWPPLRVELPPSVRRKGVCVGQGVALCVMLSPFVDPRDGFWIAAPALAALCWSFAVDLAYLVALHHRGRYDDA